MLAGLPVSADAVQGLAELVRAAGGDDLADWLERALFDDVALLALTIDERAIVLASLEDPPEGLAELRAVLLKGAAAEPVYFRGAPAANRCTPLLRAVPEHPRSC